MLHILLTTIISYTSNIHNVNKEYHTVFRYKNDTLYKGLLEYPHKQMYYDMIYLNHIYLWCRGLFIVTK